VSEQLRDFGYSWGSEAPVMKRLVKNPYLLNRVAKAVREVHEMFGSLKAVMEQIALSMHAPAIKGVKTINGEHELGRLVPSELGIAREVPELFMVRFAERSLLVWDPEEAVEDKEKKQGDFIILVDESGSMSGEKAAYAKATAFMIHLLATKQNRRVIIVPFSSQVGRVVQSPEDVIAWFDSFMGGGTSFDEALSFAVSCSREFGLREPDVVMVTDGECNLSDKVAKRFAESGMRLFVLYFGGYTHALKKVAHKEMVASLDSSAELILDLLGSESHASKQQ
jgi:uncharacterized protein with von Willebrand factor type A (vWA) domain